MNPHGRKTKTWNFRRPWAFRKTKSNGHWMSRCPANAALARWGKLCLTGLIGSDWGFIIYILYISYIYIISNYNIIYIYILLNHPHLCCLNLPWSPGKKISVESRCCFTCRAVVVVLRVSHPRVMVKVDGKTMDYSTWKTWYIKIY